MSSILVYTYFSGLSGTPEQAVPASSGDAPKQKLTFSSAMGQVAAILTVILMYFVEKLAEKISPSALKFFLAPLLTVLITAPVSLLVLGPLGFSIGQLLATFITFLSTTVGPLATGLIGAIQWDIVRFMDMV